MCASYVLVGNLPTLFVNNFSRQNIYCKSTTYKGAVKITSSICRFEFYAALPLQSSKGVLWTFKKSVAGIAVATKQKLK